MTRSYQPHHPREGETWQCAISGFDRSIHIGRKALWAASLVWGHPQGVLRSGRECRHSLPWAILSGSGVFVLAGFEGPGDAPMSVVYGAIFRMIETTSPWSRWIPLTKKAMSRT